MTAVNGRQIADGIFQLPSDYPEVMERAPAEDAREAEFRSAVASGTPPSAALDRFRVLWWTP